MTRRKRRPSLWARFWWGAFDRDWWLTVEKPAVKRYRAEKRAERRTARKARRRTARRTQPRLIERRRSR